MSDSTTDQELRAALSTATARWGDDVLLTQSAGGNTSVKYGTRLLVKASGYRLRDAANRDIFVEVDLAEALAMVAGGPAPTAPGDPRRASIETSLHAIMPQRFVVHLHMIPLIAIAIRQDARAVLTERLAGLRWGMVGYQKPGPDLAAAVADLVRTEPDLDVVVLANHGLVVAADTVEAAQALVADVFARVEVRVPPLPDADARLPAIAAACDAVPVVQPAAHRLAFDPRLAKLAAAGSYYPDHVVFLGHAVRQAGDAPASDRPAGKLILIPGVGCALSAGQPGDADEMAACLAEVLARVPVGAPLATLTAAQEQALVDWDAEKYRQQLARTQ